MVSAKNGFPKRVKIGYMWFDIKPAQEDYIEAAKIAAELHIDKEEIVYDKKLPQNRFINCIIHEIVHGIIDIWGIFFQSDEEEEKFTEAFTNGLITVFMDNQELITWCNNELTRK